MTTHDWASKHATTIIGAALHDLLTDLHHASERVLHWHTAFQSAALAYDADSQLPPYSVKEAADALGVSESTVREMAHDGRLARVPHLDSIIRIQRASVRRLLTA